jgi:galactose mutarotase-like enzyme
LRVAVMPSRGGKIVSVVDKSDGRERLWQKPDQQDFPKPKTGANYGEFNCSGIDECLPTIAPCEWRGRKLTDHGEVWTEETKTTTLADGVRVALNCPISPLRFERTLRLTGNVIQCDYKLTNTSKEPWEYQWAFHGLLAVEDGDRIVLPDEVRHLIADKSRGLSAPLAGEPWSCVGWPIGPTGFNYANLQTGNAGEKSSLKAYTPRLTEGWCALHNPRSGRLWALAFDTKDTPYVGLWINNGVWRGYHHAALEPCNGGPDRLDVAVREWKWFTSLQPGETKTWWLKIIVQHGAKDFRGLTADGHLK